MTPPDMQQVDSSNIQAIGYDEADQTLYVEFIDSGTYAYSPVPASTHEELMAADSKGSYLNREIKPNYDCRSV